MTSNKKEKKKLFKMPHSYVIIGLIIILATVMTYIVPAGEFQTAIDPESGTEVVLPETFEFIEQTPVSPFDMFKAIPAGMVEAADIIFFIFFAYGFVFMLTESGSLDGGMGAMIKKMSGREKLVIPVLVLMFGLMGATFGMYEETYGLIPIIMAMTVALGYDALVGFAIVVVGVVGGFSAAMTNPFTIGIAQGLSGLPMFSGLAYRIVIWISFMALIIWYIMSYAKKVKADPSMSYVKDVHFPFIHDDNEHITEKPFTKLHKISLILFALTIVVLVYGTLKLDWYLEELGALFIIMMIIIGLVNKYSFSKIAGIFVEAAGSVIFGALVIGISRAVLIVLENGQIIDTIIYYLSVGLSGLTNHFAAIGMIFFQNVLNFLIPSASGQAAVSMPILNPVADVIGLNRQIAVLAYQFGDGFSNLIWPTIIVTELGIGGIPIDNWYKFMAKLFVYMILLQIVFMFIAVTIGYGPF